VLAELETTLVNGIQQSTWLVPEERAAGWHDGTAPLGLAGNTVLNGHNTTRGEVFRDLYLLEPGEEIVLYADQIPYVYEIQEKLILPEAGQPLEVRVANAQYIQPTADERVTLVTCHPYNSLQNRLIIIATPVEVESPEEGNLE
jgi:LPXTG-site transpeptidase (sortase) family protein